MQDKGHTKDEVASIGADCRDTSSSSAASWNNIWMDDAG